MRRCLALAITIAMTVMLVAQETQPLSGNEIAELQTKAQAGDPKAQVTLGHAHEQGNGVAQSDELAAKWYRAAADQGNPDAQNSLGILYRLGRGVDRDKAEAVNWYRKAARQGHAPAYYNLGAAYYNGDGVPVDDVLAYAWFALAARAGLAGATEAVARQTQEMSATQLEDGRLAAAMMLIGGARVPQDADAGLGMLEELARQGSARAQTGVGVAYAMRGNFDAARSICAKAEKTIAGAYCLGYVYENDHGAGAGAQKAAGYYRRAAMAGHAESMLRLARMYAEGRGTKQDKVTALAWLWLAERWFGGATPETVLERQKLMAELTPDEIQRSMKKAQQLQQHMSEAQWRASDPASLPHNVR